MSKEKLCILGSTGSIGTQALEVASHLGITVDAICAHSNTKLLEEQIRKYSPAMCAVTDEEAAKQLKISVADTNCRILGGKTSSSELAACTSADTVLNSIIGFAGLTPTMAAIREKKNLAIANKETLVAAGSLVMGEVRKNGIRLLPVDSEHCAIHQCIGKNSHSEIKKLILTASGGPFFGKDKEFVRSAKPEDALKHPNWSMGRKITIDSASLVNKGLELIEAMWLFDMPEDKIDIVVHRESIIHSMVQYRDNSVIAQLAKPDMRLCIQYALTGTAKKDGLTPELDFAKLGTLSFFDVDNRVFPSVDIARHAVRIGGTAPCVFNSANEALVDLYLNGKISFGNIFDMLSDALRDIKTVKEPGFDDILDADKTAREYIYSRAK
ncbi:MAG: 1-deoxy-D-xylulose-5-phosphate reductoisomerase [Clostridia bacterium]|nr:1-deoxy-D-xylulose-5-phosphate reductoisomerase [Clostridia bacterium]